MNISCYGPGLGDLIELSPTVDVTDKTSVNEYAADQWRRIGRSFGFLDSLEPGLKGSLLSGGQLGSILGVGIKALTNHLKLVPSENMFSSAANLRYAALSDAANTGGGWALNLDLDTLPNGGCIDDVRVIPAVNRETYFHPERSPDLTPRDCTWSTTYPVFVGTWPWVYGHSLHQSPATLRWRRISDADPIALCARLHAASWSLAGNASIDARIVYRQLEHFRKSTTALIENVPKEPGNPGSLYRSESGLLRVYMGEPTHEYLNGPLGAVSVVAYNHVLHSVAAFFRMRSEIMKHHKQLPNSVQSILDQNPDPCIVDLRKPPSLSDKLTP